MSEEKIDQERMVLSHEPVPGYKKFFYAAIIIGVIYLAIIFSVYSI